MLLQFILSTIGLSALVASDTPPIVVRGNAFFNSETNERFYVRGLAYQPGGTTKLGDPLTDAEACGRDIPFFKELGINTIRVYTIDNGIDHSECMNLLSENGIYLILDVNTPRSSISREDPACSYNSDYLRQVFATVDEFARYDNVLGFFAGNEVINTEASTNTAPYVKAVVRDMKKYMKARGYRQVPVGYSAADIAANRLLVARYFNCGDDEDARIDMFGVNDYSWCGTSSFTVSGYSEKTKMYKDYSIPVFLSEYGCNTAGERKFDEVAAIYSGEMSSVFSGGLVYEYSNEVNGYGLVDVVDFETVMKLPDFDKLRDRFSKTVNPEGDGGYSEEYAYSECPAIQPGIWDATNELPPMPVKAEEYFLNGAGEGMGMKYSTQGNCWLDKDTADSVDTVDDVTSADQGSESTTDDNTDSTSEEPQSTIASLEDDDHTDSTSEEPQSTIAPLEDDDVNTDTSTSSHTDAPPTSSTSSSSTKMSNTVTVESTVSSSTKHTSRTSDTSLDSASSDTYHPMTSSTPNIGQTMSTVTTGTHSSSSTTHSTSTSRTSRSSDAAGVLAVPIIVQWLYQILFSIF